MTQHMQHQHHANDDGSQRGDRDNVQALRNDVEMLRRDVRTLASDAAATGRDAWDTSKEMGRATGRRAVDAADDTQRRVNDYVTDHPTQSLLVAAGIGAIVGSLLMRRRT